MRISQIFAPLKNVAIFLIKEHKGEIDFPKWKKDLIAFPVYVFICLPFLICGIYLIFSEKKFPIGRAVGTIHYVKMEEHPLFFYGASGFCVSVIVVVTIISAAKFFKAFNKIRKRRMGKAEEPAPGEDLIKSRNPPH